MMRVPLNVGWPPQIFGSATMCRPSSIRRRVPFAFAFMPMHHTMRPLESDCKPGIQRLFATLINTHIYVLPREVPVSTGSPLPHNQSAVTAAITTEMLVINPPPFAM